MSESFALTSYLPYWPHDPAFFSCSRNTLIIALDCTSNPCSCAGSPLTSLLSPRRSIKLFFSVHGVSCLGVCVLGETSCLCCLGPFFYSRRNRILLDGEVQADVHGNELAGQIAEDVGHSNELNASRGLAGAAGDNLLRAHTRCTCRNGRNNGAAKGAAVGLMTKGSGGNNSQQQEREKKKKKKGVEKRQLRVSSQSSS